MQVPDASISAERSMQVVTTGPEVGVTTVWMRSPSGAKARHVVARVSAIPPVFTQRSRPARLLQKK
ncbi:MAG TPA: hypothetical protein VHA70_13825 [Bauldia sp.]|nr:hypothetical protein [Bauldia sp.]